MANYFGDSPSGLFIEAVLADDIATARALLDSHREILTDRDETAGSVLRHLAIEGGIEGVRLLLDGGFELRGDRDHYGETPLHGASMMGHTELCAVLIAGGADVNAQGGIAEETPLHGAARHADARTVHVLIDHGADVDAFDTCESTPLHAACLMGNFETASALLERGADHQCVDSMEHPPLYMLQVDRPEFLDLFERHGFSLLARDYWGRTLLHVAAHCGLPRVAQALLARGLDPHDRGEKEWSAVDSLRLGWADEWREESESGLRDVFALFGVEIPEPGVGDSGSPGG